MTQNEIIEAEVLRIINHIEKNFFKIRNKELSTFMLVQNIDVYLLRTILAFQHFEETDEVDDYGVIDLIGGLVQHLSKINDFDDTDIGQLVKLGMYLEKTYQEISFAVLT